MARGGQRKGAGRPRSQQEAKRICLMLPADLLEEVDRQLDKRNWQAQKQTSRSTFIAELVRKGLA